MKTNMYVFVACLATLLFASCSKETTEPTPQPGGNAVVELEVKGTPMVNGRATGTAPTQANENTIKRIVVAIFNENGTTNTIAEFTTITNNTIKFNCTAGTKCTGLAVANAPTGHFANIANKTAFLAKTLNLDATLNGTASATTQDSQCLPMSGEIKEGQNASFDLAAGTTPSLTVNMSRLVARISINSMKTDFSQSGMYPKATFKLTKVFLRDALETSQPAVGNYLTTKPATLSWLHDAAKLTTDKINTNLDKPWLVNTVSSAVDIPATAVTTLYWFYAFANENADHRTALVLQGEFDPDGPTNDKVTPNTGTTAPTTVYYPIIINKNQVGTTITEGANTVTNKTGTIARNSKYNIAVVIKNIGTTNPGGTIDPADLSLTVTVADWVLDIQQNVEFN